MAKVPSLKTDRQIAQDMRQSLKERGGVTHWSFDSTARIFSDTLTSEMGRSNAETRRAFESLQISSAEGEDLDFLALEWAGISRRGASAASVARKHKNLYFFAQNQAYGNSVTGTFGDINSGVNIYLPAGTVVSSSSEINSSSAVVYKLDEDVVLLASESIAYVSATAVTIGAGMNCSDNSLRNHNFSDYSDSGFNSLKCNNRFPILSGSDREEDGNLRFRVSQFMPSIVGNNKIALRLSGFGLPGVESVKVLDGYFGIGTAAVVVCGIDHETTPALTRRYQEILSQHQGPGLKIVAMPGIRVYFDFDIRVLVASNLSFEQKQLIKSNIGKILLDTLKSMERSEIVSLSKLAAILAASDQRIKGLIGRVDSPNANRKSGFENVYIRRMHSDEIPAVDRQRIVQNTIAIKPEETSAIGELNIEFVERA